LQDWARGPVISEKSRSKKGKRSTERSLQKAKKERGRGGKKEEGQILRKGPNYLLLTEICARFTEGGRRSKN